MSYATTKTTHHAYTNPNQSRHKPAHPQPRLNSHTTSRRKKQQQARRSGARTWKRPSRGCPTACTCARYVHWVMAGLVCIHHSMYVVNALGVAHMRTPPHLTPNTYTHTNHHIHWQTEHVEFAVDFALHDCLRLNVRPPTCIRDCLRPTPSLVGWCAIVRAPLCVHARRNPRVRPRRVGDVGPRLSVCHPPHPPPTPTPNPNAQTPNHSQASACSRPGTKVAATCGTCASAACPPTPRRPCPRRPPPRHG